MPPWDYQWLQSATLADENSWLVGAVTPTVRDPVGIAPSGRPVVPLGDAYMAFDPLRELTVRARPPGCYASDGSPSVDIDG